MKICGKITGVKINSLEMQRSQKVNIKSEECVLVHVCDDIVTLTQHGTPHQLKTAAEKTLKITLNHWDAHTRTQEYKPDASVTEP